MKFITLNNNGSKVLKSLPTKTIVFNLFQVTTDIKDLIIKCPYSGEIININASTNTSGTIDTQLAIEKININDFKNKLNTWNNIFSTNLLIRSGQVTDDGNYVIDTNVVNKDDYFRVNLIGNSDLKILNVEIEIEVE